jgi:predicted metalloprotease
LQPQRATTRGGNLGEKAEVYLVAGDVGHHVPLRDLRHLAHHASERDAPHAAPHAALQRVARELAHLHESELRQVE